MTRHTLSSILRERLPYAALAGVTLVLDRLSKSLISETFSFEESRTVVGGFFDLVYLRNTGVAFGLFSGSDSQARVVVLAGLAIVAAAAVAAYSARTPIGNRLLHTALALVFGGAIGNLFDRLAYGYVIDFLYFHLGNYYWPAFNLADTAISVGVFLLAIEVIRSETRDRS